MNDKSSEMKIRDPVETTQSRDISLLEKTDPCFYGFFLFIIYKERRDFEVV